MVASIIVEGVIQSHADYAFHNAQSLPYKMLQSNALRAKL
jgi:hypothetical protein